MSTPGQALDATLKSFANDISELQDRVLKLETGKPPGPTPDPDPPTPNPPPVGNRRFGINLGKTAKDWSPDRPLLPDGTVDPEYVKVIHPVAHTLRFMDSNQINDRLDPPAWNEWIKQLDWQIDLCNKCWSNFWLNIPTRATVEFTHDTVAYIRKWLWAGGKILVEWSNEPWIGGGTDVGRWMESTSGEKLGGSKFFDLWAGRAQATFDAAKMANPGCITVLATQTASVWVTGKLHERMRQYDAVGVTTYYGMGLGGTPRPDTTLDQLFAASRQKIVEKEIPRLRDQLKFCRDNGKIAAGYEGGSHYALPGHLHESHKEFVKVMKASQFDPRNQELYDMILDVWENEGGAEYRLHFNFLDLYNAWWMGALGDNLATVTGSLKYKHAAGN